MDRLHIEKQKATIHEIILLLGDSRFKHEIDFQSLREFTQFCEEKVAKAYEEFISIETEVEELPEDMRLKSKVLELLRSRTKILARSKEEKDFDGRGRPTLEIEETKEKTDLKKREVEEVVKRREEKRMAKQQVDPELKKELHQKRNLAAA